MDKRGNTKVNAEIVREMRRLYGEGWTQSSLSRQFQISVVQVGRIVRLESWQRLPTEYKPPSQEEMDAAARRTAATLLAAGVEVKGMERLGTEAEKNPTVKAQGELERMKEEAKEVPPPNALEE